MSRTPTPLYKEFASIVDAYHRCVKNGNEYGDKHAASLGVLTKFLPSGSGIDSGTEFDRDASTGEKLVFTFSYHHMNEHGYYDGWTHHKLIVTASLQHGMQLRITGRDRNDIKEYLYQVYDHTLTQKVWREQDASGDWSYKRERWNQPLPAS